jgi:hypothetical protein
VLTVNLTSKQREELQNLKWQEDAIWERAQYILLLSEGGKVSEIAKLFNRRESSIRKWAEYYIEYGIEGLRDMSLLNGSAIKQRSILHELWKLLGRNIFNS